MRRGGSATTGSRITPNPSKIEGRNVIAAFTAAAAASFISVYLARLSGLSPPSPLLINSSLTVRAR